MIDVAVLGATGTVGQRFVERLAGHPWFRLAAVSAGQDKIGQRYRDTPWHLDSPLPEEAADLPLETLEQIASRRDVKVVFSALPTGTAGPVESRLAASGIKVFTNAADHRMDPAVPLLVPEINPDHIDLVRRQGTKGWIVANGNCTAIVLELALAPLQRSFGLDEVHVTSLQGLSGAGYPGVPSLDVVDNVLPFIRGEEEKLATEPCKTLGSLGPSGVVPLALPIHATCTRVPVREGHTESIHARLTKPTTAAQAVEALDGFCGPAEVQALPSAPKRPVHVMEATDRPQPRRDRDLERGMAVAVGRIRLGADGRQLRLIAMGSNTVRGAAGQSLLNAEHARQRGLLG